MSVTELDPEKIVVPEKPRPLGSITASAQRLTKSKLKRPGNSGKSEGWQEDAWDMYDLVGEQRFLANTLANRLSQARFFVGKLPKDSTEDIIPVTEGPAYEAFQSLIGKGQHFNQMVQRMGINLFIPGDGYLMGVPEEDPSPDPSLTDGITPIGSEDGGPLDGIDINSLQWDMYSLSELQIDDNAGTVKTTRDGTKTYLADNVVLIRVWKSHPRMWSKADSPTRSSLPVLRELVGLTMHISAQVDSRLAGAGILLIPASADQAMRAAAGATGKDDLSPFADALMQAAITSISDRSSASAVVPLMPVVPDETVEKFRFMSFSSPLDQEARELRDEAIRRLALGQDCPPELLLGVAGMNHWGAWLVREDVVTTHLEPSLALLCDAITTQFLWLVMEQQNEEDYHDYVVWYDVDHMISRPNRTQDAVTLHSAGVLSDPALRDAAGFDESDAPAVQDPAIQLALDMVGRAPSLAQNPGLSVLVQQIREMLSGEKPSTPSDAPADTPAGDGPPATQDEPGEEPTE